MTPGSGRGPEDREANRFDEAWGDLLDGDAPEPTAPRQQTIRAEASEIARRARESRENQTQGEMDWMMTVSPAESGFGKIAELADAVDDDDDEDEDPSEAKTRPDIVAPNFSALARRDDEEGRASRSQSGVAVVAPAEEPPRLEAEPARVVDKPTAKLGPVAADLPDDEPTPAPVDATAPKSNAMLWAAGLAAVGAGGLWVSTLGGDAPTTEGQVAAAQTAPANPRAEEGEPSARIQAETPPRTGTPIAAPPTSAHAKPALAEIQPPHEDGAMKVGAMPEVGGAEPPAVRGSGVAERGQADPAPPNPSGGDLRTPPPGTAPEAAAVFRKLPISPADGRPIGGIGATGVHVDDIAMGEAYENRKCTGESQRFSMQTVSRASVCVRVVHQRAKEDVSVVWEKSDGTKRRGKLHLPATHAYRTRAYLMLRREYVGDWTVRILSSDGVELASYPFTVAE